MSKSKNEIFFYRCIDALLKWLFRRLPINRTTEHLVLFWGYRFRPASQIVRLRNGQMMHVDPSDYLQCLIYYFGVFEPHCLAIVKKLLRTGDTFVDIGGNIGLYTIYGSQIVGLAGKVLTFEPIPSHCVRIRENLALNNITNFIVFETALGDKTGIVDLEIPEGGNQGCFSVSNNAEPIKSGENKTRAKISRFDDVIRDNDPSKISLIKIDIEGAEFMALQGMQEMFSKFCPSVIIELNQIALNRLGSNSFAVISWFQDKGYRGWTISITGRLQELSSDEISFCECLFIHKSNELALKVLGV